MLMPKNIPPSGFPKWRKVCALELLEALSASEREVLSRKSCVIATPMEAKDKDVRNQARNVRSATENKYVSIGR